MNLPWALEIATGHFQGRRVSSGQTALVSGNPGCIRHPEGTDPGQTLELEIEDDDDLVELVLQEQMWNVVPDDETLCHADEAEESWYADGPNDPRES